MSANNADAHRGGFAAGAAQRALSGATRAAGLPAA
jgi:hypothetical protein